MNAYLESGFYPEWASPGHRNCMVGNNSASVVADAFLKNVTKADAEKMLKSQFGSSLLSCKTGNEIMVADEAVEGFEFREGLVLVSEDGKTVCRLTLDEKLKEVLDSKSYELSSALFAGRLPE